MIVVDVGCHPQGPEESVHKLIHRFRPEILFGFDPYPELEEGVECVGETLVVRRRVAAWIHDGVVPYSIDGISSSTFEPYMVKPAVEADCFDLAEWLRVLPPVDEIVLKLDAEGAEYPILSELVRKRLDARLALVLVEWHGDGYSGFPDVVREQLDREQLKKALVCPVDEW